MTLMSLACTGGSAPASESVSTPSVILEPGGELAEPAAGPASAERELDRTIWNCEWSIVVFWGPHWHWVHRDVAMAAMGTEALYTKEDLDVAYGPAGSFSAAMRLRTWPSGQHDPVEFDGPLEPYTYSIEDRKLTIRSDAWTDGPLECVADCYDQAFIDFMDAHYRVRTSADAVADKMRAGACGG
jgi:hypothetical protein